MIKPPTAQSISDEASSRQSLESPQIPLYLQHWLSELGWLEPALVTDIAALAQRIDTLFSNFFMRSCKGTQEPDGYDGIERRGSLERLLLTEWLLASEVPEEFIRRAVMGEQLYLKPYQTSPSKNKEITLLIDASPLQWGAPRLIQLVILIVLNRYAQKHGGFLRWNFLHQVEDAWCTGLDSQLVKKWQNAHTEEAVTSQTIQGWVLRLGREALAEKQAEKSADKSNKKMSSTVETESELWFLGSEQVREFFDDWKGLRFLSCEEPLETEHENSLKLSMALDQSEQSAYLLLPPEAIQIQMLRNPFRTHYVRPAVASSEQSDLKSAFWQTRIQFFPQSNALIVRYPFDRLMIFASQNPYDFKPRRLVQQKHFLIGAQASNRKVELALWFHPSENLALLFPGKKILQVSHEYITWLSRDVSQSDKQAKRMTFKKTGWYSCFSLPDGVYLVDELKQFWHINEQGMPQLLHESVLHIHFDAVSQHFLIICLQGFEASFKKFMQIDSGTWKMVSIKPFPGFHNALKDPLPAHFDVKVSYDKEGTSPTAIAWKCRENKWGIDTAAQDVFYISMKKWPHVVGVSSHVVENTSSPGPIVTGVWAFDRSCTQLAFIHPYGELFVTSFPEKVVAWDYDPYERILAMLLMSGKLIVWNVNTANIRWTTDILSLEGPPVIHFDDEIASLKGIHHVAK